jgi:hypothetical protein
MTANSSPDNLRWFNQRSYVYDSLREKMSDGLIDLSYEDSQLKEELISQTYKFSAKGSIQITSKDEMKKHGLSSPDSLDAVLLSIIEFNQSNSPAVGSIIEHEIEHIGSFYSYDW